MNGARRGEHADVKTVLDGKGAQIVQRAIDGFNKQIADLNASMATADAEHVKALAAKDAELAMKDAQIEDLNKKVISDADLDKRVQDRADLVSVAKSIAGDVKVEGLTDSAIRKAVVVAKFGDAAVSGKSDAYVDARFDLLVEDAKKNISSDPFAAVVKDGISQATDADKAATDAYSQMVADMKAGKTSATVN
jgi:hypothetical protein